MPIDWLKAAEAFDTLARARTVRSKIQECERLGHVRVDDNSDLAIPFTTGLKNFYENQAETLFDEARTLFNAART